MADQSQLDHDLHGSLVCQNFSIITYVHGAVKIERRVSKFILEIMQAKDLCY